MAASTAKGRYKELEPRRRYFLDRARDCSALTIPSLVPPEGHNYTTPLPEPNQGLGARLVVTLASKIMMALLPPGRKPFMLGVSAQALMASGEESVPEDLTKFLVLTEGIINREIERADWRAPTTVSIQHLIVAGNVLEYLLPDNTIKTYRLDQYVVVRDPAGKLIEFVICDPLDANSLDDDLAALYEGSTETYATASTKSVNLYTWGRLKGNTWEVHQELGEKVVPNSKGYYDLSRTRLPFMALRWTAVAGEDYGRSKVEEHLPDIRTVDGLSMSIRDGAAMASRNVTLIRPNAAAGVNLLRKIKKAQNGDIVIGNPEDVEMLQFTNGSGLQIASAELQTLRQELSAAFLATQATIRDAERVTAAEIREVAQELEGVLGGVYSMLSGDMMRRRIERLIVQMQSKEELPVWEEEQIETTILTGLASLGREQDVSNVGQALGLLTGLPPEVSTEYVKWSVMLKKGFNGLDLADAVNTEEEASAIRQQRAQMEAMQNIIKQGTGPAVAAEAGAA